jgi:hypothetical protein
VCIECDRDPHKPVKMASHSRQVKTATAPPSEATRDGSRPMSMSHHTMIHEPSASPVTLSRPTSVVLPLTPQQPLDVTPSLHTLLAPSIAGRKQAWDASLTVDMHSPSTTETRPTTMEENKQAAHLPPLVAADSLRNANNADDGSDTQQESISPYSSHPFAVPPTPGARDRNSDVPLQRDRSLEPSQPLTPVLVSANKPLPSETLQSAVVPNSEDTAISALSPSVPAASRLTVSQHIGVPSIILTPRPILPRQLITDYGDPEHALFGGGWVDVSGQGVPNDYARFVRPSAAHQTPFLSVALAGSLYPYTPEGEFHWDEDNRCVRLNVDRAGHLAPIIHAHPLHVGDDGEWVHTSLVSGYARMTKENGEVFVSVAKVGNVSPWTRRHEYDAPTKDRKRVNLGHSSTMNEPRELIAGPEHPTKLLHGYWWDSDHKEWYFIDHQADAVSIHAIRRPDINGGRPLSDSEDFFLGYFNAASGVIRLASAPAGQSFSKHPAQASTSFLEWKNALEILSYSPETVVFTGELTEQGMEIQFTWDDREQLVQRSVHWLKSGHTPKPIALSPDRASATTSFTVGRSPAATAQAQAHGVSELTEELVWRTGDSSTINVLPHATRTRLVDVPASASLGDQPPDIWIAASYNYAECTSELGHTPDASVDGTLSLPELTFTLCVTLLSSSRVVLDRHTLHGVTFPSSTTANADEL